MKCHMCNTKYTLFEDKWACFRCPDYLTHEGYIAELEAENVKLREENAEYGHEIAVLNKGAEGFTDREAELLKVVEVAKMLHKHAFINVHGFCTHYAQDIEDLDKALADLESES